MSSSDKATSRASCMTKQLSKQALRLDKGKYYY